MKIYGVDLNIFYCCTSKKEVELLRQEGIYPISKEEFLFWIKYYYIKTKRLKELIGLEVDA